MPKLIIGNLYIEAVVGDVLKLPLFTRQAAAVYAKRLAWMLNKDDILVLPSPMSKPMLEYIARIMGTNITSNNFFAISENIDDSIILTSDILLNDKTIQDLRVLVAGKSWELFPYIHSSSAICFFNALGLSKTNDLKPSFMNQCGINLLNSKAIFRAIAAKHVSIAPGNVCSSTEELYYVMRHQIENLGAIIVKKDFAANGEGNIAITLKDRLEYPGVREVIKLNTPEEITLEFSKKLWLSLVDSSGNNVVVVEEYLPSKYTLYAEYYIGKNINDCQRLTHGIVRMDDSEDTTGTGMVNWIGFKIPGHVPSSISEQFLVACEKLMGLVFNLGFEGLINFDAIITEDKKILFTEVNGRLGGCTHLQPIAKKLMGPNYLKSHHILTRNHVPINELSKVINLAESLSSVPHDSGVVILNEDLDNWGIIDYMVYAKSETKALSLEKNFLALLSK